LIKRALIYFIIITSALYLLRIFLYQGLLRQPSGVYAKLKTMFLEKNNYSLVVLGSSRAEMHYDTQLLDSLTGENCFNLGLRGAMPNVAFAALKAYLANNEPPKYLLYEVDYHISNFRQDTLDDLSTYFPFLGNETLRKELSRTESRMNLFYYNPYFSLPYVGFRDMTTSLLGWMNTTNPKAKIYHNGFFHENYAYCLEYIPSQPVKVLMHPRNRNYLDSIIQTCEKNDIHLTLVTSPIFAGAALDVSNKQEIIRQVKNIAAINNLSYYDLSSPEFCRERKYFLDNQHLKYPGARLFTVKIASVFNNKIARFSLKGKKN
jgi:hypothetical protein